MTSPLPNHPAILSAAWMRPFVSMAGGDAVLLVTATIPAVSPELVTERAPVDVAFVLDRSGSMAGPKLALAKEAVRQALTRLTPRDRAALVVYDHEVDVPVSLAPVAAATAERFGGELTLVEARGSTNLSGGWLQGCAQLANATVPADGSGANRVRRAILLTDGLANQGITDAGQLAHHAGELRVRGITTTALGVGVDFDGPLLSALAEAGGGNFAFIERPSQMPAFFARELDELVTITVRDLAITVRLPEGATATLENPYPVEWHAPEFRIAVGDAPGETTIELVVVAQVPAAPLGTAHRFEVEGHWRDSTGQPHRQSLDVPPLVAAPEEEVLLVHPADFRLVQAHAVQATARLQREAARRVQRGDLLEARQAYGKIQTLLESVAPYAQLDDLQAEVAQDVQMLSAPHGPGAAFAPSVASRGFSAGRRSPKRG